MHVSRTPLLLDRGRATLAGAVRMRIAGPEFESAHRRIWYTPGPRWFTADDAIWRIHADTSMFVGGIRALLLQSLHPVAMLGVSEHSGFRGDPWGRLHRTSRFLATTTYGTISDAERSIAIVRAIHRRVRGTTPDGKEYRADDPHLLGWIHAAEVDSFLSSYRNFGQDVADRAGRPTRTSPSPASSRPSSAWSTRRETVAELDAVLARIPAGAGHLARRPRGGRTAAHGPAVERAGQGGLRGAGRRRGLDAAGVGAYRAVPAVVAGHRPAREPAANPGHAEHDPLGARRRGQRLTGSTPPVRGVSAEGGESRRKE